MKRLLIGYCSILMLAASISCAPSAMAEEAAWSPARPLHIISPGAPGAILDIAARQLAEKLAASLGQPVIVDNKPGAGGVLAMQALAMSPADGHVMAITSFVELAVNPSFYESLGYDPVRDITPISLLYAGALLLVANTTSGIQNFPALVSAAKARPDSLFYGSPGVARPPHIYVERLKAEVGLHLKHVPFKGTPPLLQALLAGEIQVGMEGVPPLLPLVQAGKLIPLAVTGERRLTMLPDVPTFSELGVAGMDAGWVGIVAPAATPAAAVQRLNRAIVQALASPDLKAAYEAGGRQIITGPPGAMADKIAKDIPQWRAIIKASSMKAE